MTNKINAKFTPLLLMFLLTSCERDLTVLRKKCSERTSLFLNTGVVFRGFDFEELQSIRMIRKTPQGKPVDRTVQLLEQHFSYAPGYGDNTTSVVSVSMHSLDAQNLELDNEIEFIIGSNSKSYELNDMTMAVSPHPNYMQTHFGCYLMSYSINDLALNNTALLGDFENIVIHKIK